MLTFSNKKASAHTPKIFVTGVGTLTPAGRGTNALWELARKKETYIEKGLGRLNLSLGSSEHLAEEVALQAISDAMTAAKWDSLGPEDGLILATTTGLAADWEMGLTEFIQQELDEKAFYPLFRQLPLGNLLNHISRKLEFRGQSTLVTTACAAGIHAVILAAFWLKTGKVRRCLVGGTEILCALTQQGFSSLSLLSNEPCRPFDAKRNGINLSEGGSFLCLETEPTQTPLAEIQGWGASLDAYHMTAPEPEGRGSLKALSKAIETAGLSKTAIDWIHAHGTGSQHNDLAESKAIENLYQGVTVPPVSSTKGTHGHFLAATGIIEVALVIESIQRQEILPTILNNTDDKIQLPIVKEATKKPINHVLKNVLGFGGTNGALVVGRV